MAKDKPSTEEILALARKQGAVGGGGGSAPAAAESPAASASERSSQPESESAEAPATPAAAASGAAPPGATGAPKSTAEILAAARAQAGAKKAGAAAPAPSGAGGAAKPAATGAPKSTAEILAAARAQKGSGTAPAAATAVKSPAKAAPRKAAAAEGDGEGERPPIQEMLRALHEGKPIGAAVAKPKLPGKPPLPARRPEATVTRRGFPAAAAGAVAAVVATPFLAGMALLAIVGGLWTLLTARFMMPNMVVELPSKFKVGPATDYPLGTVSEKYKASRGVWIVHSDAYNGENILYALASVCTHLGCTPNWLEGEQKFKCPCHGSGFYISGVNFEGPAPRPLERVGLRVAEDGMLEVDKSVKFQEELGQWQDAKSYVAIT